MYPWGRWNRMRRKTSKNITTQLFASAAVRQRSQHLFNFRSNLFGNEATAYNASRPKPTCRTLTCVSSIKHWLKLNEEDRAWQTFSTSFRHFTDMYMYVYVCHVWCMYVVCVTHAGTHALTCSLCSHTSYNNFIKTVLLCRYTYLCKRLTQNLAHLEQTFSNSLRNPLLNA